MDEQQQWFRVLEKLRIDRSRGPAPHKPLLLLLLIEMAEKRELTSRRVDLTPELAFRFSVYWSVVSHRRSQPPDVRLPFHHLHSEGILHPFTEPGRVSPDRKVTRFVELNESFLNSLLDAQFRHDGRRVLIERYFEAAEKPALYSMIGMDAVAPATLTRDSTTWIPEDGRKKGRDARFRLDVVVAYNYTCALTGYRVTTVAGAAIVDAAHIHPFAKSRDDDPRNGLALSKNAHWQFDNGLWSIDDEYRIVVALDAFHESSPEQTPLGNYHGRKLHLPANRAIWPERRYLEWHRTRRFLTA